MVFSAPLRNAGSSDVRGRGVRSGGGGEKKGAIHSPLVPVYPVACAAIRPSEHKREGGKENNPLLRLMSWSRRPGGRGRGEGKGNTFPFFYIISPNQGGKEGRESSQPFILRERVRDREKGRKEEGHEAAEMGGISSP